MAFAVDTRRLGAGGLAFAITALLAWFGTGLEPWWPLMWFAPIPVLIFALRASWWGAGLVAGSAWGAGTFNLWNYAHGVLGLPASVLLRIVVGQALLFTLAVLLFRALSKRGANAAATLAFPALWVSCEYVIEANSIHGTGGNLAYTQLGFLPFLQIASLTGPWGMSFLLLLFSSAVATGVQLYRAAPKQALRIAGASVGVIIAVLVFGVVRLALPAPGQPVKVGLVAYDGVEDGMAEAGAPTAKLFRGYADHVTKLAAEGARVVVLPEKLGVAIDPQTQDTDALFQSLANETRADIVVGMVRVASNAKYNEARIYVPDAPVATYDKQHMLPPFESKLKPGTELTFLPQPSGTWGVAICKDMDFTALSRAYGEAGAGLMLVPGWDFVVDRIHHGHMAVMRGVESGFGVVRAAKNGFLTVSDNRGRILAEATRDSAPFATLIAEVSAVHDGTLYLRFGDWFAWVVLATFAFTLARLVRVVRWSRS